MQLISDTSFWVVGPVYPGGFNASLFKGKTVPNDHTGGMEIWETKDVYGIQLNKNITFSKSFQVPERIIVAV
jgi:hypothetical protein